MKMTGTWARAGMALIWRQVSNPSVPGMTASSRITSGVTCSTIRSALAPSSATITVIPAESSASVSSRSESAESSTTRAMSRRLRSGLMLLSGAEAFHEAAEIEVIDELSQVRDDQAVFGVRALQFVELALQALDVAHPAESNQFFHVGNPAHHVQRRHLRRKHGVVGTVGPLQF